MPQKFNKEFYKHAVKSIKSENNLLVDEKLMVKVEEIVLAVWAIVYQCGR